MSASPTPTPTPTLYYGVPVPPPPGTDLSADRNPQVLVADTICYTFVLLAVTLRYISRKYSGAGFWWDDYLIIPALVCSTGQFIVQFITRAWGKHVWAVGLEIQEIELKILFAMEFFYLAGLAFLQNSVLALYWRVFNISPLRRLIQVMLFIVQAWFVAIFVMWLLQCVPLSKLWNIFEPGYCNLSPGYLFGSAFVHIFIDAILIVMPLPFVLRLQMPASQKALVVGMIMVGGFVTIVSCLRLYYVWIIDLTSIDLTWNFMNTEMWSLVELHMSVVAVCLPTLRPFYRYITNGTFERSAAEISASGGEMNNNSSSSGSSHKKWFSSHPLRSHSGNPAATGDVHGGQSFTQLFDGSGSSTSHNAAIKHEKCLAVEHGNVPKTDEEKALDEGEGDVPINHSTSMGCMFPPGTTNVPCCAGLNQTKRSHYEPHV